MSPHNFKRTLSLCTLGLAVCLNIFVLLYVTQSSPTFILLLMFSGILYLSGLISLFIYIHNQKIIKQLKQNQIKLLARWSYHPKDFNLVRIQLENDRYVLFSVTILLACCLFFIFLGNFFLPTSLNFATLFIGSSIIIGSLCLCLILISRYYHQKLNTSHETLISEDFIYFKSELFSFQKYIYFLEDVDIIEHNESYYLQLTYTTPGTPFAPFHILSIPIPPHELSSAQLIKSHFLNGIQEIIH